MTSQSRFCPVSGRITGAMAMLSLTLSACATPMLNEARAGVDAVLVATPAWFDSAADEIAGKGYPDLGAIPPPPKPPQSAAAWSKLTTQTNADGRALSVVPLQTYDASEAALITFVNQTKSKLVAPKIEGEDEMAEADPLKWAAEQTSRITRDDLDVEP